MRDYERKTCYFGKNVNFVIVIEEAGRIECDYLKLLKMKKLVILAALAALLMACEKFPNDVDEPEMTVTETSFGGIYLNGECVMPIGSSFVGGAVVNPDEGSSHRFHMYEKVYEYGPNWSEVSSVVKIEGFRYQGVTYSAPGQFIDKIEISKDVLKMDTNLLIPLDQGEYKGGCDLVSSVKITNYDFGTVKDKITGEMNDDGKIDIIISLTDGRSLHISYQGKIPSDGYI